MTKVLLADADPALAELLEDWLSAEDCAVVEERPDLVLVDLPFLRERRQELLGRLAGAYPGVPVVAMPKPLTHDAFVAVLRRTRNEAQ
jgi:hypothetical protein